MLVATPITSVAIVLGKLLSALIYVFLLIAASIPLTAVVFVYGGVGPEDVLRGYVVLLVTALGLGAFGLFCSSLVKRTQAATAITIFGVLAITIGSLFVLIFWPGMAQQRTTAGASARSRAAPPEVVALRQPVPRPGRRAVRHGDVVRRRGARSRASSSRTRTGHHRRHGGGGAVPVVRCRCRRRSADRRAAASSRSTGSWQPDRRRRRPRSAAPATRSGRRASPRGWSCRSCSCCSPSSSSRRPVAGDSRLPRRAPKETPA